MSNPMNIRKTERFHSELREILYHIAKDKKTAAKEFSKQLEKLLATLSLQPFRYRQSHSFGDERIRDLIFRGYTLPYLVTQNEIVLLGIYNTNQWNA